MKKFEKSFKTNFSKVRGKRKTVKTEVAAEKVCTEYSEYKVRTGQLNGDLYELMQAVVLETWQKLHYFEVLCDGRQL